MKAGAFGRQPERCPVQPGGRVLPGMFASPSPSPAPAATTPPTSSTSRPSTTTASTSQPKLANPSGTLLSSWGTSGRGSGRLPGTAAPSRLERLAAESRTSDGDGGDAPSRGGTSASISRARKLGLNRRARTPSPPSSPEYSPERSPPRSPSPRHAPQPRARAASHAAPPSRRPDRERSASPPSTRPRRASSPRPVAAAAVPPSAPDAAEQPQGILSSLWGRATQLVGGSAAGQQPSIVREVGHNRANSVDSSLPVPQSHVTPFQLGHDGDSVGDDEHEPAAHGPPTRKEPSSLRDSRPIALPPLVAPARTLTTLSHPAARRISAPPGLARAASEPLPPVEPITYHRPPPLHPRTSAVGIGAQRQRSGASSPYDWLESRDEAPLEPFLFTRALGRAATRRGGRAARRPAMPQGAATEPGSHAGRAGAVGAGAGGAALVGGSASHAHAHASIPPLAPPAFAYAPPVHPGAPPAPPPTHPGPPPPSLVASAFAPAPYHPELVPPPLVAPGNTWSDPGAAPALVAAAPPLAALSSTSYGEPYAARPAHVHEPHVPAEAVEPAEAAPAEPLPSYEPRVAPSENNEARDELSHARRYGVPAPTSDEEALPRSGTGPDSLPIYPSPSSGVSQPQPISAPSVANPVHVPMSSGPYSQASYEQAPSAPSAYSRGQYSQPSYAAASQAAPAPPLVPPATLAPTSQPYWPAPPPPPPVMPQYVATSAAGPSAFAAATAPAPALAPTAASSSDEHYAAHFGTTGPSVSSVLPRLFAAALPAPGPRPPATSAPQAQVAAPVHAAATSAPIGASGHGDLPAGPPILPVTPPPTSSHARAPAPTSQSLYPPHLASVQQPQLPQGALGQTSWGAPAPSPPPHSSVSVAQAAAAFARLPSPAAPTPAPTLAPSSPSPVAPSSAALVAPRPLEDAREVEEDLPGYDAPSAESLASASATSSSEKDVLSLPPHMALETPLPPSPAPPVPPASSSAVDDVPPPVPARPSSLLVDTTTSTAAEPPVSPSVPASTAPSSFVLIPPTPLEPRSGPPTSTAVPTDDASLATSPSPPPPEIETAPAPARAPVPLPSLQPLELGFTLDDLGLGTLDFRLGVPDEVAVGEQASGENEALPWPERVSSPAVQFGEDEDEDEALSSEEAADPSHDNDLDEAFDAATSFAASFAQADLSRARVDPGHSARTDRWLEQQGVERKPVGELRVEGGGAEPSAEEQIVAPGFYRPRTAPPASIAPSLLLPRAYTPAALHTATSSSFAAPVTHAHTTSLSYSPQLAYLSTLRESSSADTDSADGPPSPLETSIGMQDTNVLQRARAVSVDEVARREQVERATVQGSSTTGAARAALSDAAFAGSSVRTGGQGESGVDDKGKGTAVESVEEPLRGDKGETTDEMAAMFANW